MPQNLNTGRIVISSQGNNFNLSVVVKTGRAYDATTIKGSEILAINTDVEVPNDSAWATQTRLKRGVALGEANEQGRILLVTENAVLNKSALIGLTDEKASELLTQGFKLLEQA